MNPKSKAQAKYDKIHTIGIYLKLNLTYDNDVIQWLWNQSSKQGSIKALIREAIADGRKRIELPPKEKGEA